jgi:hypothetical protein
MTNRILSGKNDYSFIGEENPENKNKGLLGLKIISVILTLSLSLLFGFLPYFW